MNMIGTTDQGTKSKTGEGGHSWLFKEQSSLRSLSSTEN